MRRLVPRPKVHRIPALRAEVHQPFARVLALGHADRRLRALAGTLAALLIPAVLQWTALRPQSAVAQGSSRQILASVERVVAPPPPLPPPPSPPPQAKPPPAPAPPVDPEEEPPPESPPPEEEPEQTAQAGQVLGTDDPASEWEMPQGLAGTYAGGVTSGNGTSSAPVATSPQRRSRARTAFPDGSAWTCPWPSRSELRLARVHLRVSVDTEGHPVSIEILDATTPEFVETTRQCALGQRYRTALDEEGRVIAGVTPDFGVLYTR